MIVIPNDDSSDSEDLDLNVQTPRETSMEIPQEEVYKGISALVLQSPPEQCPSDVVIVAKIWDLLLYRLMDMQTYDLLRIKYYEKIEAL